MKIEDKKAIVAKLVEIDKYTDVIKEQMKLIASNYIEVLRILSNDDSSKN